MINTPKFKSKYHIEEVPGDGYFLLSENENHILEGESLRQIIPFINGKNTWQDIRNILKSSITEKDMDDGFNVLINHGHVIEQDSSMPPQFEPFWTELGMNTQNAAKLVSNTNILIKAFGNSKIDSLASSLLSFGFELNNNKAPNLIIVTTDDYQYSEIEEINNYSLKHNIPWVLVKPDGLKMFVGPFIVPHKTACWKCLQTRLKHNREVETYIQKKTNKNEPFPTTKLRIPLAEMQAVSITVLQVVRWISQGQNELLESRIMAIDLMSAYTEYHYVTRRPQCDSCGNPSLSRKAGLPIVITNKLAIDKNGNGSRMESPEDTFARYAHHVSSLTGIVKNIVQAPWSLNSPVKMYLAGHNFALKNDQLYFLKDGLRTNSSGKGRTDAQAKTSALCEALERYSGVYKGEETQLFSSYKELKHKAIDPREVMLFSEKQYDERLNWLNKGRFQIVPERFDEDVEISWSPLWSLKENCVKYLPTSYLYFGFSDENKKMYCWGDSNGNAAGSCLEDAILQGFLELIERDSVALWWYNQINRKQVDLASLQDPYIDDLIAHYHNLNREFWVLDLTSDTGIPAFVALNRRTNHEKEDIIMGFGAHLDARIAINRAVTEMNQFIHAVLSMDENGDAIYSFNDPEAIHWWKTATIQNQPYLLPQGDKIKIDELPFNKNMDIKEQLETCFNIVNSLGLEVLILDQTRPDIGLPVVKVIVPGIRHFWARFAKGRLYDVPVKMGWLEHPKTEEMLNPIPMFL